MERDHSGLLMYVPYILIPKREADSLENKSSPTILSPTRR